MTIPDSFQSLETFNGGNPAPGGSTCISSLSSSPAKLISSGGQLPSRARELPMRQGGIKHEGMSVPAYQVFMIRTAYRREIRTAVRSIPP